MRSYLLNKRNHTCAPVTYDPDYGLQHDDSIVPTGADDPDGYWTELKCTVCGKIFTFDYYPEDIDDTDE